VRVKGYNPKGEFWRIGVDKPIDDPAANDRQLQAILNLTDIAMATSGNYRRFYVEDGMKYSHTIDPQKGYPVDHNLLSATVFTDSCMDADAYATAFMVMGLEKSIEFARNHPRIAGIYLIYDTKEGVRTYLTEELADWLDVQD
jgi:FAD:protein FMN transferase